MLPITNADFSDMQGLIRFGYGKLTAACFLLIRIHDATLAARWLATAPVTTAELQNPPPRKALQLAFTSQGLVTLGLSKSILDGFSGEFLSGMTGEANRSRRLGDVGDESPDRWLWGSHSTIPDFIALIYAQEDLFEEWNEHLKTEMSQAGCTLIHCLTTNDMGNIEPFGFADGVSSPVVDWDGHRRASGDRLTYENTVMTGEFVLGYENEYGLYTQRPLVEDPSADLPDAIDTPGTKDLGRNGTYLVFRHIDQDVHGFWHCLLKYEENSHSAAIGLAEHLVGRRMNGQPLLPLQSEAIPGVGPDFDDIQLNQFSFDQDPSGTLCPLGAHVRRANPRNADLPFGTPDTLIGRLTRILALDRIAHKDTQFAQDRVASTRFHRLLRRGREYGPPLTQEQRMAPASANEPPSGLHFICLNANIGRQFEFVQGAWLQSTSFDGLQQQNDPLIGNRLTLAGCPAPDFTIPRENSFRRRIKNLPRFTTVRGGAYCFLPGIRALRYIARAAKSV